MGAITKIIRNEPALISGAILAVLSLLVAFGADLSQEQTGAIMAVASAVMAVIIRSQVTPTIRVSAEKDKDTGTDVAGEAVSPEIPQNTPVDVTAVSEQAESVVVDVEAKGETWKTGV